MVPMQQALRDYEKACQEARGQRPAEYIENLAYLKKKWPADSMYPSEQSLLMGPIIHLQSKPLFSAIIADNLKYFVKNFEEDTDEQFLLEMACLSGSKQIVDFLLKKRNLNYLSPDMEYILSYVSASKNSEWLEQLATIFANAKKPMPKDVFVLADREVLNMIVHKFDPTLPKNLFSFVAFQS